MRGLPPDVPLLIPARLVADARLYAVPGVSDVDAVCHVLQDYPNLVADLRKLRSRVAEFDDESAALDQLVERLQVIARQIVDL